MTDTTPEWTPAFEGQRPPFEKGNTLAEKHGARSQRRVEELAKTIDADLLERAPWVADYPEALHGYARAEAVAKMLFNELAKGGLFDKDGKFREFIFRTFNAAENTAGRRREELGLTPRSEATVARDRALAASATVDAVGEVMRQGRATRAHQETNPEIEEA